MLLVAIAAAGACAILLATRPGIGLYSDSTYYLSLARRLLGGNGYTIVTIDGKVDPVARYPFVYPTILAIPGLLRFDLLAGARWIGAIIFFANILLMGSILHRGSGRSTGTAVLCAVLTCASYDMLSYHSIALSDAPFLLFILIGFSMMARHIDRPSRVSFWCSAAATGLALAIRYAGAAFVIAGCVAILAWGGRSLLRRTCDAVLFGCSSSLLMILWILRNAWHGEGATGRHLAFHPAINMAQVKDLIFALSAWASNGARTATELYVRGPIIAGFVFALVIAASLLSFRRLTADIHLALPLLYFCSYAAVLLLTSTFLQADLFLDSLRILMPLHVFALVLSLIVGNRLYRRLRSGVQRVAAAALCVVLCSCFLVWAARWVRDTGEDGQGYASSTYTDSEMLQAVRELPPGTRFYSNLPWPIGIYTDRVWALLPTKIDIATLGENPKYRDQVRIFTDVMRQPGVYLASYNQGDAWYSFPTLDEIKGLLPLRLIAETEDGTIYGTAAR
jgi:hypothetical protein